MVMPQQEQDERQKIQRIMRCNSRISKYSDTQMVYNFRLYDVHLTKDRICDECHFTLRLRLGPGLDSNLHLPWHDDADLVVLTFQFKVRKQYRGI